MADNPFQSPPQVDDTLDIGPQGETCPKCGQPMQLGHVVSAHSIKWSETRPRTGLVFSGESLATNFLGMSTLGAKRCQPCELILFRYGSLAVKDWQ